MLRAIRILARETGLSATFVEWLRTSLLEHAAQIARATLDAQLPATERHLQRQYAELASQAARRSAAHEATRPPDAPGTPTNVDHHTWFNPHSGYAPEEIFTMDYEPNTQGDYADYMQADNEEGDYTPDDIPALMDTSGTEEAEDADMDNVCGLAWPWFKLPATADTLHSTGLVESLYHKCASTLDPCSPLDLGLVKQHTGEILGDTQCPSQHDNASNSPIYLEASSLPGEEACSFPDDDALADNTHLSLSGLVDASNLTQEQYKSIVSVLEKNKDVFCFHPSQLGTCTVGSHIIDTGDAAPIKQTYYKMPYKKQEELKAHVQQWLELGVIRPSNSPWASPVHLVPKKGGDTRGVINYSKLNACTRKDAYPLPRIDDILYNMGPASYFSTVDLFSGYFQVTMAGVDGPDPHNSIAKTAFCCPWGLFEFTKVPFGLTNAPATFMRIMNEVLQQYVGQFIFVFLDDIIVYSRTFEEHLHHLQMLFQALRTANLRLSSTKCRFAARSCTFLGFSVSPENLGCDPRLTEAISLRPEPYMSKNPKKAVMSFLGLCSFYRRFVKDFAAIAEPLTRLTAKNQPFVWGAEQQEAFDILKAKLMDYPILRRPDFDRPFFVHTDASLKAVGAVLTQRDDSGREYAVAYHSAKLSAAQRNWAITHLECYAVVNAVCDHWKDILLGHEFTVITDHVALKWLMTSPNLQGKLARWSLRLQEFLPFTIEYRKGAQHLAADAMSRDPRHEDDTPDNPQMDTLLTMEAADNAVCENAPPDSTSQGHSETPPSCLHCAEDSDGLDPWMPIRISIEGNIGCGKSTAMHQLQELQDHPQWCHWLMLPEPVADWHSLLDPFYSAPSGSTARHTAAIVLQQAVLNAYAVRVPDPMAAPFVISERSPWSSLAVFLPIQELPPNLEQVVYQTAHHMHTNLDNALPTALVYLRTTPETCLARIRARQRPGESSIALEYLQQLHQQYEQQVALFPGPKVVVHAQGSRAAVFAAVKAAIQLLFGRHAEDPPSSSDQEVPCLRLEPTAPFTVHNFATLRRLCIGQLLTTLDPFYLAMFPDQLLVHEELEYVPDDPDTHPQGTPEQYSSDDESDIPPVCVEPQVQCMRLDYMPTPLSLLYDASTEVTVLYQEGPGTFNFSPDFCAEYVRRHNEPVDINHRVDNSKAAELYAAMGPWQSSAEGANIAVAVAPKKALPALRVATIHSNGAEAVFVDPNAYASYRTAELGASHPNLLSEHAHNAPFPWECAFINEAYTLDGWVRLVRLRPLIPCGVGMHNPVMSTLMHGAVPPLAAEHVTDCSNTAARLASCLPHSSGITPEADPSVATPASPDMVNMLDRPPPRKSAKRALKRLASWTQQQQQAVTTGNEIPSDLPCRICKSPHDWERLLVCDQCDDGYHTYCLGLAKVPKGPWKCPQCCHPRARAALILSDPDSPALEDSPSIVDLTKSSPEAGEPAAGQASPIAPDSDACSLEGDGDGGEEDDNEPPSPAAILEIWQDLATMNYLKTGQCITDPSSSQDVGSKEMKRVEKRAKGYTWEDATQKLFKLPSGKHSAPREVPPPDKRDALIDQSHIDTGHLGPAKLCSILLARYYWRGIYSQVSKRLEGCEDCLRHKTLFKIKPPLRPLPPSRLWERVSLDSMGPYPPTKRGSRYCCVGIDAMSKYVECWAVRDMDSATMAQFFMTHIYANHGLPRTVVTDNGKEFQHTFANLMIELGVDHLRSAAYNPQSNGQAEAAVKTILHGLQKAVGENPNSWDDKLPHVLMGLRCAVHSTTGFSPFFINTGRHPTIPVQLRINTPPADATEQVAGDIEQPVNPGPSLAHDPVPTHLDQQTTSHRRRAPGAAAAVDLPSGMNEDDSLWAPATTNAAAAAAAGADNDLEEDDLDSLDRMLDPGTTLLLKQRQAHRQATHRQLESNILRSQVKQKADYAKRHHGPAPEDVMPPGSLVLMWVPPKSKLHKVSAVEGPYRVVEYVTNAQAIVEDAKGQKWPVAVSRLAPYRA
jgi:thymidylate kinase